MRRCVTITAGELCNCLAVRAAGAKSHYLVGSITRTETWRGRTCQGHRLGSPSFSETLFFQNNSLKILDGCFILDGL